MSSPSASWLFTAQITHSPEATKIVFGRQGAGRADLLQAYRQSNLTVILWPGSASILHNTIMRFLLKRPSQAAIPNTHALALKKEMIQAIWAARAHTQLCCSTALMPRCCWNFHILVTSPRSVIVFKSHVSSSLSKSKSQKQEIPLFINNLKIPADNWSHFYAWLSY